VKANPNNEKKSQVKSRSEIRKITQKSVTDVGQNIKVARAKNYSLICHGGYRLSRKTKKRKAYVTGMSGHSLPFFCPLIFPAFFLRIMVPVFMGRKLPAPQALGNPPLFAAPEAYTPGRKGIP